MLLYPCEKIRKSGCCYIDKTGLIGEILNTSGVQVMLITRPRRFGKTLGMNMLANFFDISKDSKALFEGLEVSKDYALCEQWRNQWPVLFVSFRRVDGLDFQSAYGMLEETISDLCEEHRYLLDSSQISDLEKSVMERLIWKKATDQELKGSLLRLTRMMQAHYGKPIILLIDEYDVPLAKASANGYYKEMLDVMKGIMQAMKDNSALQLAVITGCLRIAKESIFTGTNNFVSDTITSSRLNEYFGFTQAEVDKLLEDTGLTDHAEDLKAWYDGYHFGEFDIYCPWDVMNYLQDLQFDPSKKPVSNWKNTSDNAIIRSFIDYSGPSISKKLELLLSGGYIVQTIEEDLTYDYLHSSEDNLWSILYLTGYLTRVREIPASDGALALTIPNAEVQEIFRSTIQKWFKDSSQTWNRQAMFQALWAGNSETLTKEIGKLLRKTISYHDYKEDFYHAFLAGILASFHYSVESNREHGEGRSDIVVYDEENSRVVIFEAKVAKSPEELPAACDAALCQIEARQYAEDFRDEYDEILCYGIAFYKKRCLVKMK
ncbi:MAG: AAA family ATPase [Clostridiales bacterium]|nr:AAA family ATPase [Clostridiales bacterium]